MPASWARRRGRSSARRRRSSSARRCWPATRRTAGSASCSRGRCPGGRSGAASGWPPLVLVVASGFLAAIPWMVAFPRASLGGHQGDSWLRAMLDGPGAAFFFILIVLAVGLANFSATAVPLALAVAGAGPRPAAGGVLGHPAVRRSAVVVRHLLGQGDWSIALRLLPLALGLVARQRGPGRGRPDRPAPRPPRRCRSASGPWSASPWSLPRGTGRGSGRRARPT